MALIIERYNAEWTHHFQRIKSDLEGYLANIEYVSVEHIGSTPVPGLSAQPIIDVKIIAAHDHAQVVMDALLPHGEFDSLGDIGRYGFKAFNQSPPCNVYISVSEDDVRTKVDSELRNILCSNTELRDNYARMKLEHLTSKTEVVDYAEAKYVFIKNIINRSGILTQEELIALERIYRERERWGMARTSRLVLREFSLKDVVGYFELESNEENAKFQDWTPRTMKQAQELVSANIQASYTTPRTVWELVVESEGRMIGRVGALSTPSMVDDEAVKRFNLWFSFLPSVHGKGFATEAMRAFIHELIEKQSEISVQLEIECDPRNTDSCKLAERLGFKKHSLTLNAWESKGEWVDSLVYRQKIIPSQVTQSQRQS